MPLLDFPFIYHGGSWFKGPYEIVGDQWMRRRNRADDGRGRAPGIDVLTWNQKMKPAEQKADWTNHLAEFGEPPRIPTPVEVEAKQLVSPNQRSDLRDKAKAECAVDRGAVPPVPAEGGGPIVIYDDWKLDAYAHRDLGRPWTGRSRFEVSDGSWREVVHDKPRRALMTPTGVSALSLDDGLTWTGDRETHVSYVGNAAPIKTMLLKKHKRACVEFCCKADSLILSLIHI